MGAARRGGRPTVRDVAAEAGVSVATVSRVLAGASKFVSQENRAKVLAAAERIGYATNIAAKSLATGRSGSIGVLVPDLGNQYFTSIVQSIVHAARADGVHVLVGDSLDLAEAESDLAAQTLLRSDGVILCSPRSGVDALAAVLGGDKPVVAVNRRFERYPQVASVVTDTLDTTREIVEHLFAHGHDGVAFVGATLGSAQNDRRWQLVHQLARAHRARSWQVPLDGPGTDVDRRIEAVLADGCTAVVAANDLQAAEVYQAVARLGLVIPRDVSVVGFDDTPLARWLTPRLTTASMYEAEVGRAAWAAMHHLLDGDAAATHVSFSATPVYRDSVGAAPSVDAVPTPTAGT